MSTADGLTRHRVIRDGALLGAGLVAAGAPAQAGSRRRGRRQTVAVLGAAVGSIINIFNPRLVILGGGVTAVGDQLIAPVRRIALERAFPSMAAEADVVIGQLGADIGIMGAVAAAQSRLANRDAHLASQDARPTTS